MILFFNRKEVFIGYSIERFTAIRQILELNHIGYTYKVTNRNSSSIFGSSRGHAGSFGEKAEYAYLYYIYVHKNDYEKAVGMLK